jgi:hypothetical protein
MTPTGVPVIKGKRNVKKFFRWSTLTILSVLVLAVCIPALLTVLHAARPSVAHATGNTAPTISLPGVIHAYDMVEVTGQGFLANDQVYLSLANSWGSFASIPCDNSGNCSGTVTIPSLGPQGMYSIVGADQSGLSAQTMVTVLPGLYLSNQNEPILRSGGPGTILQLTGGSFNAYETVAVYWDKKKEGTTSTDYNGNLQYSFTAPVTVTPGNYSVIVMRSNQSPASVSTPFTILAPTMKSPGGIRNSQPVHVKLAGFQAGERVTISWNANNGQTMTTLRMDSTGAIDTYFAPPFAPGGSYILTATGNTSKLQASSAMNIGPGIILNLNTANPGGTITVEGGGYTPGETINVYFQNTGNGVVTATIDASGSFSVPLSVPVAYKKNMQYYVYANSTNGLDHAKAQFFYAIPSLQLTQGLTCGESFTITGQGFVANDTIDVLWQAYNQHYPTKLGTVVAASDGTFSFTSTAPSAPYENNYYNYNYSIIARGHTDNTRASFAGYEYANILATPSSGPVGTKVHIEGGGFGSHETVTITLARVQVATLIARGDGGFTLTVRVPDSAIPGGNYFDSGIIATGSTTGISKNIPFFVNPTLKITPATGPSGTTITVFVSHCYSGDNIYVYWYYPDTKTEALLTQGITSSKGSLKTTIQAPANLVSGTTYYVLVYDLDTGGTTQVPFVAQ